MPGKRVNEKIKLGGKKFPLKMQNEVVYLPRAGSWVSTYTIWRMRRLSLRRLWILAALACAPLAFPPASLFAKDLTIDDLIITRVTEPDQPDLITWDPMDTISTDTAGVTLVVIYRVYISPGYLTSTTTLKNSGTLYAVTPKTSVDWGAIEAYSIMVEGQDLIVPTRFDASPIRYYHPIHYNLSPMSPDIKVTDTQGGFDGMGAWWNFDYKLVVNYFISLEVYPSGTTFTKNASGIITGASQPYVKRVLDQTPRSAQMAGDTFINHDSWDIRSTSGTVSPKGLYPVLITAYSPFDGTTVCDTLLKVIPNDNIRLWNILATPITDSQSSSQIGFTVNSDCLVTLLVAQPGTKFRVATAAGSLAFNNGSSVYTYAAGDNIPLDPNTLADDGTRIVHISSYNVTSGDQVFAWNGANTAGTNLASGLYAFTLSATDAFGNHAIGATGNNYAQWGTIAINRASSQPSVVTVAAFPSQGALVPSGLNSLYARFVPASPNVVINGDQSGVVLLGPDGKYVPVTRQWRANESRLDYTPYQPLTQPGDYQAVFTVRGQVLPEQTFETQDLVTFSLQAPAKVSDAYLAPNPVKGVEEARVVFTLDSDATVTFQVMDIAGQLLLEKREQRSAGPQTLLWNLRNESGQKLANGLYIYKLRFETASGSSQVTKKFSVVQ